MSCKPPVTLVHHLCSGRSCLIFQWLEDEHTSCFVDGPGSLRNLRGERARARVTKGIWRMRQRLTSTVQHNDLANFSCSSKYCLSGTSRWDPYTHCSPCCIFTQVLLVLLHYQCTPWRELTPLKANSVAQTTRVSHCQP